MTILIFVVQSFIRVTENQEVKLKGNKSVERNELTNRPTWLRSIKLLQIKLIGSENCSNSLSTCSLIAEKFHKSNHATQTYTIKAVALLPKVLSGRLIFWKGVIIVLKTSEMRRMVMGKRRKTRGKLFEILRWPYVYQNRRCKIQDSRNEKAENCLQKFILKIRCLLGKGVTCDNSLSL